MSSTIAPAVRRCSMSRHRCPSVEGGKSEPIWDIEISADAIRKRSELGNGQVFDRGGMQERPLSCSLWERLTTSGSRALRAISAAPMPGCCLPISAPRWSRSSRRRTAIRSVAGGSVDNPFFQSVNRNKKSVSLDLKTDDGLRGRPSADRRLRRRHRELPHWSARSPRSRLRPAQGHPSAVDLLLDHRLRQRRSLCAESRLRHRRPGNVRPARPAAPISKTLSRWACRSPTISPAWLPATASWQRSTPARRPARGSGSIPRCWKRPCRSSARTRPAILSERKVPTRATRTLYRAGLRVRRSRRQAIRASIFHRRRSSGWPAARCRQARSGRTTIGSATARRGSRTTVRCTASSPRSSAAASATLAAAAPEREDVPSCAINTLAELFDRSAS